MKLVGTITMLLAMAGLVCANVDVPEIEGSSAASAVALIVGGLMVARSRRK